MARRPHTAEYSGHEVCAASSGFDAFLTWAAHAVGSVDRQLVDALDSIDVPPANLTTRLRYVGPGGFHLKRNWQRSGPGVDEGGTNRHQSVHAGVDVDVTQHPLDPYFEPFGPRV